MRILERRPAFEVLAEVRRHHHGVFGLVVVLLSAGVGVSLVVLVELVATSPPPW